MPFGPIPVLRMETRKHSLWSFNCPYRSSPLKQNTIGVRSRMQSFPGHMVYKFDIIVLQVILSQGKKVLNFHLYDPVPINGIPAATVNPDCLLVLHSSYPQTWTLLGIAVSCSRFVFGFSLSGPASGSESGLPAPFARNLKSTR